MRDEENSWKAFCDLVLFRSPGDEGKKQRARLQSQWIHFMCSGHLTGFAYSKGLI